ncbi:hypothetical protein [Paraglaciecola sp. 2405UD69-4]|uniref:hypothetical protein n=1 Tax=Paraglaciecola sp. 2405UD69-4 TaxID=3391836 RepID=UPI0039C94972
MKKSYLLITLCLWNSILFAQDSEVVTIEETIRANQEQPKVLTIVPWQAPTVKEGLPSHIVERINKQFSPLQRGELLRELKVLRSKNTYPKH